MSNSEALLRSLVDLSVRPSKGDSEWTITARFSDHRAAQAAYDLLHDRIYDTRPSSPAASDGDAVERAYLRWRDSAGWGSDALSSMTSFAAGYRAALSSSPASSTDVAGLGRDAGYSEAEQMLRDLIPVDWISDTAIRVARDHMMQFARRKLERLTFQPSPPPTGSEREKVVEECAGALDAYADEVDGLHSVAGSFVRQSAQIVRALATSEGRV